jgi:hypothetical protein
MEIEKWSGSSDQLVFYPAREVSLLRKRLLVSLVGANLSDTITLHGVATNTADIEVIYNALYRELQDAERYH